MDQFLCASLFPCSLSTIMVQLACAIQKVISEAVTQAGNPSKNLPSIHSIRGYSESKRLVEKIGC